jgi:hypothetical protein
MNFNNVDWMALGLGFGGQTVFLTIALWIMLKMQGFDRNIFGLIGAAALACAIDHIPYVGWYVSGVVLLLCVTKLIHARTFTDAIFTVAIAYAITFAFNMFVITALMADLRPSAKVRARIAEAIAARAAAQTNELAGTASNAAPVPAPASAAGTPANAVASPAKPVETATAAAATTSPSTQPPAASTNAAAPVLSPEPGFDTNRLNSVRLAGDIMKHFFVKGVSQGTTISIAMLSNGTRNFDIATGDTLQLQTSDGKYAAVRCKSITDGEVVLNVEGVDVTLYRR